MNSFLISFGFVFLFQVQNIDDVLQRGTVLSGKKTILFSSLKIPPELSKIIFFFVLHTELDTKTQNLSMLSQKYKKDATYLNQKSMYVKAAAAGIVVFVFILYFWIL